MFLWLHLSRITIEGHGAYCLCKHWEGVQHNQVVFIFVLLYICGNIVWKTHLPRLRFRFDLNVEVHKLDILWPGAAFTPPYEGMIDSGVDHRCTRGIPFDWTFTQRHRCRTGLRKDLNGISIGVPKTAVENTTANLKGSMKSSMPQKITREESIADITAEASLCSSSLQVKLSCCYVMTFLFFFNQPCIWLHNSSG